MLPLTVSTPVIFWIGSIDDIGPIESRSVGTQAGSTLIGNSNMVHLGYLQVRIGYWYNRGSEIGICYQSTIIVTQEVDWPVHEKPWGPRDDCLGRGRTSVYRSSVDIPLCGWRRHCVSSDVTNTRVEEGLNAISEVARGGPVGGEACWRPWDKGRSLPRGVSPLERSTWEQLTPALAPPMTTQAVLSVGKYATDVGNSPMVSQGSPTSCGWRGAAGLILNIDSVLLPTLTTKMYNGYVQRCYAEVGCYTYILRDHNCAPAE